MHGFENNHLSAAVARLQCSLQVLDSATCCCDIQDSWCCLATTLLCILHDEPLIEPDLQLRLFVCHIAVRAAYIEQAIANL
jgi:hypothetical protein